MHLAIIGTGNVTRKNYLPFLARQADVRLSYWNRTRDKAEACAREFGGTVADSIGELMAGKPDALLVLTAEQARYDIAVEALMHRPPRIFFEKPLTARHGQERVDEADFMRGRDLLTIAAAGGTATAMGFNFRFFDQVLVAQRLIAERALGKPLAATALIHWKCWSHCIDLLTLLAGPATSVTAMHSPGLVADGPLPIAASFLTTTGACGTVLRTGGKLSFNPLYELTVGFEHGRLHLRGLDGECELTDYRTHRQECWVPGRNESQWNRYDRSFERELTAYLDALRAQTTAPVPGLAGLHELRFEAGIARASLTGGTCDLERDFPIDRLLQGATSADSHVRLAAVQPAGASPAAKGSA